MSYFSILLILLLLGAGAGAVIVYWRPRFAATTLLATAGLLLLLWLPGRLRLPVAPTVRPGEIGILSSWSWQMSAEAWWLGLCLFLLLAGAALLVWERRAHTEFSLRTQLLPLLLVGATLLAVAADSLATLLASWLLLDGIWFLLLIAFPANGVERATHTGHLLFPGAALLLLWLAAITLPEATGTTGLDLYGWPTLTRSLLLLSAVIQVGAFPFHLWRPLSRSFSPLLAPLAYAAPATAGAALLVRLEAATDITLAFALPLTLTALLGLLWSANAAWRHSDDPPRMTAILGVGQAGLLLLAGTWAGPEAIVAEARVLLLGGGVLLLAAQLGDGELLRKLGPLLAVASLAGLPLTAGFTGRTAVYDAWLAEGRGLLVFVSALLHIPFIAAALLLVWDGRLRGIRLPQSWSALATLVGLMLPALGLLAFSALGNASIIAWLAVLLPAGSALLLIYYLDETDTARQAVREALSLPFRVYPLLGPVRDFFQSIFLSVREAVTILEGERGLLWLFLFLLLIWFVRLQL